MTRRKQPLLVGVATLLVLQGISLAGAQPTVKAEGGSVAADSIKQGSGSCAGICAPTIILYGTAVFGITSFDAFSFSYPDRSKSSPSAETIEKLRTEPPKAQLAALREKADSSLAEYRGSNDRAVNDKNKALIDLKTYGVIVSNVDTSEALKTFQRALELDPSDIQCLLSVGSLHFDRGELSLASEYFDRVIATGLAQGKPAEILARYGRMLVTFGQTLDSDLALNELDRLIGEASTLIVKDEFRDTWRSFVGDMHIRMAWLYCITSDYMTATKEVNLADHYCRSSAQPSHSVAADGCDLEVILLRGSLAARSGNPSAALSNFKEAREKAQRLSDAQHDDQRLALLLARSRVGIAESLASLGSLAKADDEYQDAIRFLEEIKNRGMDDNYICFQILNVYMHYPLSIREKGLNDKITAVDKALNVVEAYEKNENALFGFYKVIFLIRQSHNLIGKKNYNEANIMLSRASSAYDQVNNRLPKLFTFWLRTLIYLTRGDFFSKDGNSNFDEAKHSYDEMFDFVKKSETETLVGYVSDIYYERLGDLCSRFKYFDEAADYYQREYDLLNKLPQTADNQFNLANCLLQLGQALRSAGRMEDALTKLRDSVDAAENLAQGEGVNIRNQGAVANAQAAYGDALLADGQKGLAKDAYQRRLGALQFLVNVEPKNDQFRLRLSDGYDSLGDAYPALGDFESGLNNYKSAFSIRSELAKESVGNRDANEALAVSHFKLGSLYDAGDQIDKALPEFQKYVNFRREEIVAEPASFEKQEKFAKASELMGRAFSAFAARVRAKQADELKALKDALAAYKDALAARRVLATIDRNDVYAQSGLADAFNNVAEIYGNISKIEGGDHNPQISALQSGKGIREKLVNKYHSYIWLKKALADQYERLGDAFSSNGAYVDALRMHERALTIWNNLIHKSNKNDYLSTRVIFSLVRIATQYQNNRQDGKSLQKLRSVANVIASINDKVAVLYMRSFYNYFLSMHYYYKNDAKKSIAYSLIAYHTEMERLKLVAADRVANELEDAKDTFALRENVMRKYGEKNQIIDMYYEMLRDIKDLKNYSFDLRFDYYEAILNEKLADVGERPSEYRATALTILRKMDAANNLTELGKLRLKEIESKAQASQDNSTK